MDYDVGHRLENVIIITVKLRERISKFLVTGPSTVHRIKTSKLTIKIPGRRQWRRSGIFIVNFEHLLE